MRKSVFFAGFGGGSNSREKSDEGLVYKFGKRARGCNECLRTRRGAAVAFSSRSDSGTKAAQDRWQWQVDRQTGRQEPVSRARILLKVVTTLSVCPMGTSHSSQRFPDQSPGHRVRPSVVFALPILPTL